MCALAQTLFAGMMQYDGDLRLPAKFLVPPPAIDNVSGVLPFDRVGFLRFLFCFE